VNLTLERIALAAERLHLPDVPALCAAQAEEAVKRELSYAQFLEEILVAQSEAADRRAADTLLRLASFPQRKTLEEFTFSFQPSISRKQVLELASCAFVERAENVILLGPPGVGKTHLAVALGVEATKRRLQTKFTTAARMMTSLAEARTAGTFSRRLTSYLRPRLLIIDEVGFLALDSDQASLLFEVVSRRYERGSIILTSNKSYGAWAEVFSGDQIIATAILDRLLHHATTIAIKGDSYRLKDKKKAGVMPETRTEETK
jgi:DNA replication protein DnaC